MQKVIRTYPPNGGMVNSNILSLDEFLSSGWRVVCCNQMKYYIKGGEYTCNEYIIENSEK